eukprot:8252938-Alexandrium_andersonii.AAC.1
MAQARLGARRPARARARRRHLGQRSRAALPAPPLGGGSFALDDGTPALSHLSGRELGRSSQTS